MPPRFILASGSPRRKELLGSLGVDFEVIKSDIDETQHADESPLAYVERLSGEKAAAVAAMVGGPAYILAADTVVILAADTIGVLDGEIIGKPADAAEARTMLQRLRARAHTVCTSMTLLRLEGDGSISAELTRLTQTDVFMRDYTPDEVEAYIASGDPFDKAGGYAIQHEGFHPVAHIDGSYTNVVGLPVETLREMLDEIGWTGA